MLILKIHLKLKCNINVDHTEIKFQINSGIDANNLTICSQLSSNM